MHEKLIFFKKLFFAKLSVLILFILYNNVLIMYFNYKNNFITIFLQLLLLFQNFLIA